MFKKITFDRKTLLIIGMIAIAGVIAWLASSRSQPQKEPTAKPTGSEESASPQTEAPEKTSLVAEKVNNYQFYPSGLYFFRSDDNSFYHQPIEGGEAEKIYEITGLTADQWVYQTVFCPEEPRVIVKYAGQAGMEIGVIDLSTGAELTKLSEKASHPQWQDAKNLIYFYQANNHQTISRLNLETGKWQALKSFNKKEFPAKIEVSTERIFYSQLTGPDSDLVNLFSIDFQGRAVKKIAGRISSFKASPDGQRVALLLPQDDEEILEIKGVSSQEKIESNLKVESISDLGWTGEDQLLAGTSQGLVEIALPNGDQKILVESSLEKPIGFSDLKNYQGNTYFLYQQSLYLLEE